jgi:hypothetical protein
MRYLVLILLAQALWSPFALQPFPMPTIRPFTYDLEPMLAIFLYV